MPLYNLTQIVNNKYKIHPENMQQLYTRVIQAETVKVLTEK